ncbi:DnaJ domain-containing protein [Scheffersomyces xylosifermentans]|uniref:DnaJ domain-containing protein n=1 Tax=Scheffersomyces xylosifermentans TaxID=1304137 RepID=UPI00315CBC12
MRLASFAVFAFVALAFVSAAQWSPQDYEIFSLNDKIKKDLGQEYSFYSWLGLEQGPKATTKEITKAYRKLSRTLHPDKYKGSSRKERKHAEERFQRLSLVGNILRDVSLRKRYDYFLDKGFPERRGTGYYYSKFRPGFIATVFIVFIIIGTFHFVGLTINRRQDFKRIADMKNQVKSQAWGGSLIAPNDGSDRRLTNEATGKTFVVKNDGSVFVVDTDNNDELIEIDEHDINVEPGFKESLFFKIPVYIWNNTVGKFTSLSVDTTIVYQNQHKKIFELPDDDKKKTKKKTQRGNKIELPNGKVVYGRPNGTRNRK